MQSLLPAGLQWRHVNTLDLAPNCWWSLYNLQNLYVPFISEYPDMTWGAPEEDFFTNLFAEVPAAPNNYIPLNGEVTLYGQPHIALLDHLWITQAFYQHHSSTYVDLVTAHYSGAGV